MYLLYNRNLELIRLGWPANQSNAHLICKQIVLDGSIYGGWQIVLVSVHRRPAASCKLRLVLLNTDGEREELRGVCVWTEIR